MSLHNLSPFLLYVSFLISRAPKIAHVDSGWIMRSSSQVQGSVITLVSTLFWLQEQALIIQTEAKQQSHTSSKAKWNTKTLKGIEECKSKPRLDPILTFSLTPGDLQWMTAGRGIVHAEMPIFEPGGDNPEGLQLWIDLPKAKKGIKPSYQEMKAESLKTIRPSEGVEITIISGESHGESVSCLIARVRS